jgi:membrane protein insertase Oxa1/YidC/SpoIIIJ
MVDTLPLQSANPPARGLAARILGVLTSPRTTYADVAAHPRWLGVLVVVLIATILPTAWLLSTSVGQRAVIDQQLQTLEAFGRNVTDEQLQQMERMAPYSIYFAAVSQIIFLPLVTLVIAGVAFAIFNGALGANAAFRQVFAVVAFSSVLAGLRTLFSTPLNFARESLSSPTTLAAVLPFFEDNTFAARLLGSIDLFLIWWIVNLAIGLGVLYRRRTAPIATSFLAIYGAIALTIAAVRSVLAGA